jgi:hypothetical protein
VGSVCGVKNRKISVSLSELVFLKTLFDVLYLKLLKPIFSVVKLQFMFYVA